MPPRDPKRIPTTLNGIKRIWEQQPELRLGQIIDNFLSYKKWTENVDFIDKDENYRSFTILKSQLFYVEDDDLLEGLETWYTALSVPKNSK